MLWDIVGLEGVGGVLGTIIHEIIPCLIPKSCLMSAALIYSREENENVEVDDGLCEMVLCDNNNISCAQSVDRAMNAKNGWTGDVIDPASDLDNMKFP
ncbi:hypothetical protein V6N12_009463 [Hibiscus sabdariffa]|uniref:Uncharacterized protein n=1 Tax=Hibiscus sabdariffa TaxID=183260 RepID=A0ABR2EBB2_9ROSI